jgi:hypothetical protein
MHQVIDKPTYRPSILLEQHRDRTLTISWGDRQHLLRNLEAEFNEVDILPKTKDAVIMATAAYIDANAPNDDEHMPKFRALALEGVRVLQTARADEPARDPAPRRHSGMTQQQRSQPAAHFHTKASRGATYQGGA